MTPEIDGDIGQIDAAESVGVGHQEQHPEAAAEHRLQLKGILRKQSNGRPCARAERGPQECCTRQQGQGAQARILEGRGSGKRQCADQA